MDKSLFNVSKIESFFYELLKESFPKYLYVGDLPRDIADAAKTLVVIDCGYVATRDAYAVSYVSILIYGKPFSNGAKSVANLTKAEDALVKAVEASNDVHYRLRLGNSHSSYDSARNLHCNVYSIELTIV